MACLKYGKVLVARDIELSWTDRASRAFKEWDLARKEVNKLYEAWLKEGKKRNTLTYEAFIKAHQLCIAAKFNAKMANKCCTFYDLHKKRFFDKGMRRAERLFREGYELPDFKWYDNLEDFTWRENDHMLPPFDKWFQMNFSKDKSFLLAAEREDYAPFKKPF